MAFAPFPAFEIASELLRYGELELPEPLLKHLGFLLLLAHVSPDMLRHSCLDIASAAVLAVVRIDAGPTAPPAAAARLRPLAGRDGYGECAARLQAISYSLPAVASGYSPISALW
jgi:hypothetical protein